MISNKSFENLERNFQPNSKIQKSNSRTRIVFPAFKISVQIFILMIFINFLLITPSRSSKINDDKIKKEEKFCKNCVARPLGYLLGKRHRSFETSKFYLKRTIPRIIHGRESENYLELSFPKYFRHFKEAPTVPVFY